MSGANQTLEQDVNATVSGGNEQDVGPPRRSLSAFARRLPDESPHSESGDAPTPAMEFIRKGHSDSVGSCNIAQCKRIIRQ